MLEEKKVRVAFAKVKNGQDSLIKWILYFKERIDELSFSFSQINELQKEVQELKTKFNEALMKQNEEKPIVHQNFTEEKKAEKVIKLNLTDLTEQQKKTFFIVGSLQREHGAQYVPVRLINAELYGNSNIEKMQTTVANYLKRLEELQLIERIKKGRLSYVKLSECGMNVLAAHHVEKIKTPIQQIKDF